MYRIRRTRQSNIDLYRQYNYIFFDLANPIAANNFINRILKSISKLEYLPYRGKKVSNSNIRYIYFKNYLILYTINNQNVEIQRIFHKRQNFKNVI